MLKVAIHCARMSRFGYCTKLVNVFRFQRHSHCRCPQLRCKQTPNPSKEGRWKFANVLFPSRKHPLHFVRFHVWRFYFKWLRVSILYIHFILYACVKCQQMPRNLDLSVVFKWLTSFSFHFNWMHYANKWAKSIRTSIVRWSMCVSFARAMRGRLDWIWQ